MAEKTRFGALLKRYRRAAELSQEALAEHAGLSARAISDLERGINRAPRSATLELLARALSLSSQQRDLLKASVRPEVDVEAAAELPGPQPGIPLPPTHLIGRQTERAQVLDMLHGGRIRLLTLTGPSGVGKTRLALELAQDLTPDFPDGIVCVPLASLRDASLVPGAVAQGLRIHESPADSIQDQVIAFLKEKHLLLVLDNLEQVLDCSPFVASLLANCPRLAVLATSRSPLRLRAEQEFGLAPLPLEDAVTLFCERAQAVQPGRTFARHDVAAICEQLDCLPLAIELAASQARLLPLSEMRNRLGDRFALLRKGARDLPPRQQTMEQAIAWSYDLLTEPQQRCFRRLGIFVGGWTLEAAEAVSWAEQEMAPQDRLLTLAALVEASLVQTEIDAGGGVRLYLLELIREYALQRLRAAGEVGLCRHRHAAYYARLAETAESAFESGPDAPDLSLARELSNVQAALQWAEANRQAELGLQLCGFGRLWHKLGQPSHAGQWFERMLALDHWARTNGMPAAPLSARLVKLCDFGRLLLGHGQIERSEAVTMEALRLAQQLGDENGLTDAWANKGLIAQASGKLDEAEEAFRQASRHARQADDHRLRYRALVNLAEISRLRGQLARAAVLLGEALASAQAHQFAWDVVIITTLLGRLAHQQKNLPLAKARYRESLGRLRAFASPTYIAWCLEGCAAVLSEEGRAVPAVRLCAAAAKLRKQADTPLPESEREAVEHVIAALKEMLGQANFLQEWAIGAGLTQHQAVEAAVAQLD